MDTGVGGTASGTRIERGTSSAVRAGQMIISSDEADVLRFIRASAKPFYVYVLHRPGVGPFYVGKGTGNRLCCHIAEARNTETKNYRLNIIRKIIQDGTGLVYEIDSFFDTEPEAFTRERLLIRSLGRFDLQRGPLANMTDGGEGLANPSQETQQKQRACWSGTEGDTDYALVNRFFTTFMPNTEAVPIKPVGKLRVQPLSPHPKPRSISQRQCAALLASAVAHRIVLAPGCEIPRRLTYAGTQYLIENGVGRDILKSGVARLSSSSRPCEEVFELTAQGFEAITNHFGRGFLESHGVLVPL